MAILVRAPNWLGDLVMSLGFFNKLALRFPRCDVQVIVKEELAGLASLFPQVTRVYGYSRKKYKGMTGGYRFMKENFHGQSFDRFFCLTKSFSSAWMGFFSHSRRRTGYSGELRSLLFTHTYKRPLGLHRAQEYAYLLHDCMPDPADDLTVRLMVPDEPTGPLIPRSVKRPVIVLNANSEAQSRRMSLEKWSSIARKLIDACGCSIFLIGSGKERKITGELSDKIDRPEIVRNLAGATSPGQLASVLKCADLLVSTDSGPAHLANSVGTPVVVLFGAGDECNTAPFHKDTVCVVRAPGIACAPCVANTCKYDGLPRCLQEISEENIVKQCKEMVHLKILRA